MRAPNTANEPTIASPDGAARRSLHILISVDAVGGVWRYAMDLAASLGAAGYRFTFAGFGPQPSAAQRSEAERFGELVWFDVPLDWTAEKEADLDVVPAILSDLVRERGIELVHLNLPSQACGLTLDIPVLVVSHSCVVTWFAGVRQSEVPADWMWQYRLNRAGFDVADVVVAPSHAHADMLRKSYGHIDGLGVVYNGTKPVEASAPKENQVFSAGRWWDDGKNGAVLDAAAPHTVWPVIMAGSQRGPNGQYRDLLHARYLGELPHGEIMGWMTRSAIVASPSLYEPFGLAPLEAAQAGAALVLADIPTYRELWDGAAVFAPANDAEAFAAAINRLANDDLLRGELARNARERSTRFTLEAQAVAMQSIYQHLLHPVAAMEA
ncbi:glycosyltransferase family 4 protein [Devosia submarina]|uniref:glycosyltransferase family 4 protein n=1 Tax=Devosia submarina TaxID=1173082 RepID=UPI000D335620|nr:glycosyltransferase family 4 protein [Devosia submarina]